MPTRVREDVLVTAPELARLLKAGLAPVLLDVRWSLAVPGSQPQSRADYAAGHIPGAIYVDLDSDLSDHANPDPLAGRHPLPSASAFETTVRGWGISENTPVVVYDDNASQGAARAWWLLKWAGLHNVRVLDGGWSAWNRHGFPVSTEEPEVTPSEVTITPGSMPVLSADEIASLASSESGAVLDARAGERYRGETEPLDAKAGHIPGAKNAPSTGNMNGQEFLSTEELEERFSTLGALWGEVGVYCGSGVTACHDVLSLYLVGVDAALYPASWSGWSSDPERPVAVGEE